MKEWLKGLLEDDNSPAQLGISCEQIMLLARVALAAMAFGKDGEYWGVDTLEAFCLEDKLRETLNALAETVKGDK